MKPPPKKTVPGEPELYPTNYFVLYCFTPESGAVITRYPSLPPPMDNWTRGYRWEDPVPQPICFEIDEEDEGVLRPFFEPIVPLMRADLLEALRECGCDNLDDYDAVIRETRTGKEYVDYRAVNIIGLVAAADLVESDAAPSGFDGGYLVDTFFRKFKMNEAAAHGQLVFRLAEKVSAIFVHTKVKDHLLARGFDELTFMHPAKWAG